MKLKYIILVLMLISIISGCIDNFKTIHISDNTSKITSQNITTNIIPISTPTSQSKYVSRYIDNEGNLHEVEDYTSMGGGKYDNIIDTDISVTENKNRETLQDKIDKQNILDSGIIGKWKFENSNGYMIYTFNSDGTSTLESNVIGKSYYTYTVSKDSVQKYRYNKNSGNYETYSEIQNNINLIPKDGYGSGSESSIRYRLEDKNNLVLDILMIPINFERIW